VDGGGLAAVAGRRRGRRVGRTDPRSESAAGGRAGPSGCHGGTALWVVPRAAAIRQTPGLGLCSGRAGRGPSPYGRAGPARLVWCVRPPH
jgi:hypothetical protein